ncbi:MAG: limonene-1,2-epoxide hydrolase family protein [Ilumatobacteraceae bacterium]
METADDKLDVIRRFMAAMEKLDYDRALTLVSDDVQYTNIPLGTVRGPDGIRSVLEPFFAPTVTNEWLISNTAVNGDTVFLERTDRHQLARGWVELPVVGVFVVREGRIVEWRDYFDFATIQNGFAAVGSQR